MHTVHSLGYAHPATKALTRRPEWTWQQSLTVGLILSAVGMIVSPMGLTFRTVRCSRIPSAMMQISCLQTAIDAFQIDCGRYPTAAEGLDALVDAPKDVTNWKGPYLKVLHNDPWGRPYRYVPPSKDKPNAYQLICAGPDGKFGTADDIIPPP